VLASVALTLLLVEWGLRLYHAVGHRRETAALPPVEARCLVESADPRLIVELNPGHRDGSFSVNSWGMPYDEVAKAKPEGVFRIAFVGDSLSCGFKLPVRRSEIYLEVLERLLNEDAPDGLRFECLNFGVNSYGIRQSLRVAETRVPAFSPDLIVAQGCLNDPYPSDTVYATSVPPPRSRLAAFLWRRLRPARFWAHSFVERAYDDHGRAQLGDGIAGFGEIARRGRPTLLLLFPYLYRPAYESWGFDKYHRLWSEDADRAGLPFVDLYADFERAGLITDVWPQDPIHPRANGHRLAAEVLLRELRARGLLAAQPSSRASTKVLVSSFE